MSITLFHVIEERQVRVEALGALGKLAMTKPWQHTSTCLGDLGRLKAFKCVLKGSYPFLMPF